MSGPGLYIHIPYCRSKCSYCAFYSTPIPAGSAPAEYCTSVQKHLEQSSACFGRQVLQSLFIGGGTPTVCSGQDLADLIQTSMRCFRFADLPEITVETNPNSCTLQSLQKIRVAGVNRLSIGVQSFDDALLARLGRTHSVRDVEGAMHAARQAGFENINLDLMYGLPGQEVEQWQRTLSAAVHLKPEHLALYELSVEEGTPLAARIADGSWALPDEDTVGFMAEEAYAFLAAHGFERYEISNFARPGRRCLHNINYWQNGSYLGVGAAAVSCFDGVRLTNVADTALYVALVQKGRAPYSEGEILSNEASFRESVIMGMRMLEGVSLAALKRRYDMSPQHYYGATLQRFIDQGLVAIDQGSMRLTAKALPVANQVLSALV